VRDIGRVPLENLALDPENPRLPEVMHNASEARLLEYIFDEELLDELAASFVANGYFENEPVLVLPPGPNGKRIVVEGNRRVSTLKVLLGQPEALEAGLEFDLSTDPSPDRIAELSMVPAFEVTTREELDAYLGFRHIGGLRQWSAEAKARWIHKSVRTVVDGGAISPFYDVGRIVGSNARGVRTAFITLELLRRAKQEVAAPVEYVERNRYSVWGLLVANGLIKNFINFDPSAREYGEIQIALESVDYERVAEIVTDLTPPKGQKLALLSDSRQVSQYAEVLANPRARSLLREYGDLELAISVLEVGALADRLRSLTRTMRELLLDAGRIEVDRESLEPANELFEAARSIRAIVADRLDARG